MPKIITKEVYELKELKGNSYFNALENLIGRNINDDWWISTYEYFSSHDQVKHYNVQSIEVQGFDECFRAKLEVEFIKIEGEDYLEEEEYIELELERERIYTNIQEDVRQTLLNEWEWTNNEENLKEIAEINEYYFEADGTFLGRI